MVTGGFLSFWWYESGTDVVVYAGLISFSPAFVVLCLSSCGFLFQRQKVSRDLHIPLSHIALANPVYPGLSLEKMDDLFGVTELLQQKEDPEHSSTPAQADKATESHVERVA
jgi:hypothetical protein